MRWLVRGSLLFQGSKVNGMNARALVIGAGVMGERHAAAITAAGDSVAVVVDADVSRAEALASHAQVFHTLEEAVQRPELFDLAVVATPSSLHLQQSLQLVNAGIPVLVEKPHRIPGQSPDTLRRALDNTGGVLFAGMSTRHWPGFENLHRAISDGDLGEILSYRDFLGFRLFPHNLPPWYFDSSASGGGVLVTNGVHAFDRLKTFLGDLTVEDVMVDKRFTKHNVDTYALTRGHIGSARVSIELSWSPFAVQNTGVSVIGTRGSALVRMDGSWVVNTNATSLEGNAIDLDTVPFARQWKAFCEGKPGFGFEDVEPTIELIQKIYDGVGDE